MMTLGVFQTEEKKNGYISAILCIFCFFFVGGKEVYINDYFNPY